MATKLRLYALSNIDVASVKREKMNKRLGMYWLLQFDELNDWGRIVGEPHVLSGCAQIQVCTAAEDNELRYSERARPISLFQVETLDERDLLLLAVHVGIRADTEQHLHYRHCA